MSCERILFVTGRLAERSLRRVVGELGPQLGFDYEVQTLGISVAALMHCDWVARKLEFDGQFDRVILPGWCQGDLQLLSDRFDTPFERGIVRVAFECRIRPGWRADGHREHER